MNLKYYRADVFSNTPFSGNGLTVFPISKDMPKELMQVLTQEMRQFESIFYYQKDLNTFRAFIFTMEEELDFAGHPILGLGAVLHDNILKGNKNNCIQIELNTKTVAIETLNRGSYYSVKMNQGIPEFNYRLDADHSKDFLLSLNLGVADKYEAVPLEVVSTGLPYLIVPVKSTSLHKVKVVSDHLEGMLQKIGAKFFYVLDIENRRGRTWDNLGMVEDIATGSAAGPVGAYLVKHGFAGFNKQIRISQGEYVGRKSKLKTFVSGTNEVFCDTIVEGDVVIIGNGNILIP